jgi:NTE family protein
MLKPVTFCLLITMSVYARAVPADPPEPAKRPRVGVALGGGAALGLSHIGVLKWFEEHRIPVDFVAGTSMGGLVGGLYATGHTAAEMTQFVEQINWEDVLRLGPKYQDRTYRRKQDLREFPNQMELGIKKGIRRPEGLSSGHGVGLMLSRITRPYGQLDSFDELPIPFRCVATDLLGAKSFVFENGSMFDALRSTMAIPGVFTPWRARGTTFVDGGTLNNLPVDVVRAMGADIVIAVELESPPVQEKDISSILGVAVKSINVMITDNEKRSMKLADIVVKPKLNDFESTDYDRSEELEKVGYDAAVVASAQLEKLALSQEEWDAHLRSRMARRRSDEAQPAFVTVSGATDRNRVGLERPLKNLVGKKFDQGKLESELDAITGLGRYASADYGFVKNNGTEGVDVRVREKSYSPPILNTGILLEAANGQDVIFGIGARLTFLDFGGPGSEWRTDVNLGGLNNIVSEYYWRVKGSRFFLAPRGFFDIDNIARYSDGTRLAEYQTKQEGFGFDLGVGGGRFTELRAGVQVGYISTKLVTGTATAPNEDGGLSLARVHWVYEGQDSGLVPRHGLRAELQAQWVFDTPSGVAPYPVFSGTLGWAKPLNDKWSLLTYTSEGSKSWRADLFTPFTLGGPARMGALGRNQLIGSRYYFGSAGVLRSIGKPSLAGRFYAACSYEIGNAWYQNQSAKPYQDVALGLAGETFFGLVYTGVSIGDKGERKVFFRLGRVF